MPANSKVNKNNKNELIRHHCEEISTHLGALKQLLAEGYQIHLKRVGKVVKFIHQKHGGHPDA